VILVIWLGGLFLTHTPGRSWPLYAGEAVFLAASVAAALGLFRRRLRTQGLSIGDAVVLRRILRRGELPADPTLRSAAPGMVRRMHRAGWVMAVLYPLFFGALTGFAVSGYLISHDRVDAGFAALFGAVAVVGVVVGVRWIRRTRALQYRLSRSAPPEARA
jgi:hypothetical protein